MNQTTLAASTNTDSVGLEALRLQLEEVGKMYNEDPNSEEPHDRLLHTLQTNDCREIISAVVDGDDLANVFALAANKSHVDILEAFLYHGMNVDIKSRDGWTALMYSSCKGHEECVRWLLAHHADVEVQNNNGYTALMIATQFGKIRIVQILLEKNANPDLQDSKGMTELMWASVNSHKTIVQVLLNHGANIELKNNDGKTALDLADDEEIVEMIQNHVNNSYVLK